VISKLARICFVPRGSFGSSFQSRSLHHAWNVSLPKDSRLPREHTSISEPESHRQFGRSPEYLGSVNRTPPLSVRWPGSKDVGDVFVFCERSNACRRGVPWISSGGNFIERERRSEVPGSKVQVFRVVIRAGAVETASNVSIVAVGKMLKFVH
jgi:hypothetical protein